MCVCVCVCVCVSVCVCVYLLNVACHLIAVQHGGELPYVFGYPFFDENLQELTGIRASYNYTDEDRSFSEKVMTMWSNFAKYG